MTAAACPACATAPMAEAAAQDAHFDMALSLPGIHCAGCIGKVERGLSTIPGVRAARVNLSLKRVSIATDLPEDQIVSHLADMGYEAHPLNLETLETRTDRAGRALLLRLGVAGFAMMNVMLLSVAVWSGATDATRDLFHLISAAIALPVVAYSGQPFFRNAWTAIRAGGLNMDVPISLAILLAAGMSLFETLNGGRHAYFDAALSLTFFLLIGRYLDHRTRSAARSAAKELSALEVHSASRVRDGVVATVPLDALVVGDELQIATGMRVPVDGQLLSAEATTDRAFLTGESDPAMSVRGADISAGEVNLGAPFRITATAVGNDTTLRRVAALVDRAENARNRYTSLADRAARIYAPAVHLLAFAAFVAWYAIGGDLRHALNIAIAVLIITCPCALGLAVPAVSTAAIGKLYSLGFLVKSGTALERLAEVDMAIFDKTGTLTVPGIGANLQALSDSDRGIALALAQASEHPMSRAVQRALAGHAPADLTGITEHPGDGVSAQWNGQEVRLGRGAWLGADFDGLGLRVGNTNTEIPQTEALRPGISAAIPALRAKGLDLMILTGDRDARAETVGANLGIADIRAGVSTEAKHDLLASLPDTGRRAVMVGDGLNDAASLAAAHASIAPSTALDATRNAADIVVLRDDFSDLPTVFATARSASRLSRQNFAIAAAYNFVAVPIALAGFATPLIAALAMSASSLTVLANALRVRFAK